MASSRFRRKRQAWVGLLPRLGQWLAFGWRWIIRHPQPFVCLLFVAAASRGFANYVQQAEAFRVAQVVLPADIALQLPEPLIGKNLWQVDLKGVSVLLKKQQPALKDVRVTRQLPDTIRIYAIPRMPVAQVKLDRWYAVDREGFILPDGASAPDEKLVRISGIEGKAGSVRAGRVNEDEALQLGLRVLARLRQVPSLSRRLREISVADFQQLRFLLDDEMEIRCGSEGELEEQLHRFQAAMKALAKGQQVNVRYIDVRFQQPVVGQQT